LPAGFVVPAQPVQRAAPPSGADWVHEIKHDGYRIIVRRDGERVRLFSRKAIDWTARLPAIAEGARRLKARSFTLDGEAVVVGPNGLTDFEALRRRGSGDVAVLLRAAICAACRSKAHGVDTPTRSGVVRRSAGRSARSRWCKSITMTE
jgi:bifunctional non-homologous end joining protein LigD